MRSQLLQRGNLLDEKGCLTGAGYATSLVKDYRRKDIKASSFRIKEWDYYLIYNEDFGIALTLADNGYMGLVGTTFLDFKNATEKTTNIITPIPMGRMKMPESSVNGDVSYQNKRVEVSFQNDGKERHLYLKMKRFHKDKDFFADVTLTEKPELDSMVIATPFPKKKKTFYYNQKIIGMQASGCVIIGEKTYSFGKSSLGLLDWGRGVWTYNNVWYWGAGQGQIDGKSFGFNLGYGFGDTKNATENMIFYEGKAHKFDDIEFIIPKDEFGKEEYLKPWKFISSDQRFDMEFTPILDRKSRTSFTILLSDQHQVFGKFNGKAILDDGTEIIVTDFLGFAEKVHNKW